ncbi:hypothetical protein QVD17_30225 [Tagetes erecta]|uniref:HTH myb-type domain-containing protein n=1 Tax=Tagetes erecta TaxID=13708 RepID=A0AAD8NFU8_TARER|nr:hypothetical protein QVD17_30225 [Tagetes erecta]
MGSLNPELTLDFKPTFIPKTISEFLRQLSKITSLSDKIFNLDDFLSRLQTEMRKIDAFKRELPLCMLLINDAIITLKEEAMVLNKSSKVNEDPVLEEFIPLKKTCDEEKQVGLIREEKGGGDNKKNWLSSTQLWNINQTNNSTTNHHKQQPNSTNQVTKKRAVEDDADESCQLFGNTFIPIPGLSVITPGSGNILFTKMNPNTKLVNCSVQNDQSTGVTQVQSPPQQQTCRKQRRCWSTELHRRFVNALQELGGSHAATPKQIRELMQVEGLTNDEVKSHLQKYRLHTRRHPSSNNAPSSNQSSGVLGGGMWMQQPHDQFVEPSKHGVSHSNSPDGPFLTGTTTTTGGDSMDDGEDAKSENYCWKGV